ncbi:toll/interleukin-1 receptor domain-containing protein [Microbacterium oxydans]|uniref:toll/interleukin-1 receptor domain-containing protein n=1 Tax=Microbacterium oxydans TaxID=82380 RepID=UPI00366BFA58
MVSRRMPSQSQIRSQMRAAGRKAEQQFKSDVNRAQRQFERDAHAAVRKAERDFTAETRSSRPTVSYTVTERAYLEPVREIAAEQAQVHPERRDVFLCHAWDDREGAASELHDLLESYGVDVWFSEKDVALGTSLTRSIDKGLRMSRMGVVLMTPHMLKSLANEGVADQELSALLATERVIPVAHGITYEQLRAESPLLGARAGLTSDGVSLVDIAVKIANAVRPEA